MELNTPDAYILTMPHETEAKAPTPSSSSGSHVPPMTDKQAPSERCAGCECDHRVRYPDGTVTSQAYCYCSCDVAEHAFVPRPADKEGLAKTHNPVNELLANALNLLTEVSSSQPDLCREWEGPCLCNFHRARVPASWDKRRLALLKAAEEREQ